MFPFLSLNRQKRERFRRVAAFALFALQGAVALSPMAEPAHSSRPTSHVEEQGSTHLYGHDESACAVCALGSMHAAIPERPAGIATPTGRDHVMPLARRAAPAPDAAPTNHSRAPPPAD